MHAAPAPHVALIGMMGAGKSTAAASLAARWNVRCVDVDVVVEAQTGKTLRELWCEGGTDAYRPLERRAVHRALTSPEPVVLAAPGGVVVDEAMAECLRSARVTTVHLRAGLEVLVRNVGHSGQHHRPLLGDDPRARLRELLDEREGLYEDLADLVVDVDHLTPAGVVGAVAAAVAARAGSWPNGI